MTSDSELTKPIFSSFRDPDGFLFQKNNILYRQVNLSYQEHYLHLKNSGLLSELQSEHLLINHVETSGKNIVSENAYCILQPENVTPITYPYEWCFSQLQDAALLTLRIQQMAMKYKMSLKDASAYNIQFHHGKPIFIDTLSFEKSKLDTPWVAYRQFCQHFLAPLAVAHYLGQKLNPLLKTFIDGIPLDLTSRMLPLHSWLRLSLALHIHLHSKLQREIKSKKEPGKIHINSLYGILDNLQRSVTSLRPRKNKNVWANYYSSTHNYTDDAVVSKENLVKEFLEISKPNTLWDVGSNTGRFSRIAAKHANTVLSMDYDPDCVEINYLQTKAEGTANLLPLVFDLTNPSPGIGWHNQERSPLESRSQPDLIMALAFIHHLTISGNLPFHYVAEYFSTMTKEWLIIEFIPKQDAQVQKLLQSRKDIFGEYTYESFKKEFGKHFTIHQTKPISESGRIFLLMKKIEPTPS